MRPSGAGADCGSRLTEIILLRAFGAQPPLFVILQPTMDLPFELADLKLLDESTPIVGIVANAEHTVALRTVQGMAARIAKKMREIQRSGPYRLAAWDASGALAYETAIQLLGTDEAISFLGLFESGCPSDERSSASLAARSSASPIETGSNSVESARVQAVRRAIAEYEPPPSSLRVCVFSNERAGRSLLRDAQLEFVSLTASLAEGSSSACQLRALNATLRAAQLKGNVRPHSSLVRVQSGKRGASPVFCVPGAGASVTDFVPLSEALGADCPVFGFQPRGMDSIHVPHSSVQAAANVYLSELQRLSPYGSVYLVGHSFGGWVAFEMALQLEAAGRRVESLLLLDTDCPEPELSHPPEYTRTESLMKLVALYEQAAERSLELDAGELEGLQSSEQMSRIHAQLVRAGLLRPSSAPQSLRGSVRAFEAALRVAYTPQRAFSGVLKLVLVPAFGEAEAARAARFEEQVEGWRRWAVDIRFKCAEGNHVTLLKNAHVGSWAELARAEAGVAKIATRLASHSINSNFHSLARRSSYGQND